MDEEENSCSFDRDNIADEDESDEEEERNEPLEFRLGTLIVNPRQKSQYIDKLPRVPTDRLKRYNTGHYVTYDPGNPIVGPSAGPFRRGNRNFGKYDNYKLVNDNTITLQQLPKSGVRLSDYWAAKVAVAGFSKKELAEHWPAEFDSDGMIKAERFPLGNAAKIWVKAGTFDVDGNAVPPGQDGWYYLWYRGIHILMGDEGLEHYPYMIRTSFEAEKCQGLHFRASFPAAIQGA